MEDTNGKSWKDGKKGVIMSLEASGDFCVHGEESGKLMPIAHRVEYLKPIKSATPTSWPL